MSKFNISLMSLSWIVCQLVPGALYIQTALESDHNTANFIIHLFPSYFLSNQPYLDQY